MDKGIGYPKLKVVDLCLLYILGDGILYVLRGLFIVRIWGLGHSGSLWFSIVHIRELKHLEGLQVRQKIKCSMKVLTNGKVLSESSTCYMKTDKRQDTLWKLWQTARYSMKALTNGKVLYESVDKRQGTLMKALTKGKVLCESFDKRQGALWKCWQTARYFMKAMTNDKRW